MSKRFTEKAEKVLNNAVNTAEGLGHTYIGSEHILLSLAKEKNCTAAVILLKNGINYEKLLTTVKDYLGNGVKSTLTPKDMTPRCRKIVENSYKSSIRYGALKIGTEHILLSLLEERDCIANKILSYCGADITTISDEVLTVLRTAEKHFEIPKSRSTEIPALSQYGKNLTDLAINNKLDPVVGREKETERLIRILCRKTKNNPCLIGEAGVGKTAIVEGLANKIAHGEVPLRLINKQIISVDLTSMVAGAKYRGDFEERIKSILNEASKNKSIILFIDEIHTIVGAGSAEGAIDAANILKPQLSRAEIQLIGATTFSEYHKYIEKDAALERRFQALTINEPGINETIKIINGLKKKYEEHHSVIISDDAISAAVRLSERYIQDRFFPDKAIDVIDEACAKRSLISHNSNKSSINSEQNIINEDFIFGETKDFDKSKTQPVVTNYDIEEIINEMTGIPLTGLNMHPSTAQLSKNLKEKIFGQNDAIDALVMSVIRSESGINNPDRPKGIFLFIGGSGVGKTELAKTLSEELFHDKKSLIRYDMSEFSEKNSVTMLIGSPPGYVGYEEGGSLTEKIRRHPYSVILFDEIEKAHPEVLNLFLQIMDDGALTDSCGRKASFKNAYIIMTSNAQSEVNINNGIGFLSKGELSNNEDLYKHFSPEFINRIDSIIYFSQLNLNTLISIANKKLEKLKERLADINISLSFEYEVCKYIAKSSFDKKLGARSVLRAITQKIENEISSLILEGKLKNVNIKMVSNKISIEPEYDVCIK